MHFRTANRQLEGKNKTMIKPTLHILYANNLKLGSLLAKDFVLLANF